MSTASNIFPQLQQNPVMAGSRVSPYKQIADANRLKLKTIQAQYFQNEYKNILTAKQRQKQAQRQQRERERQTAEAKKLAYAQQLQRQKQKKQLQRAYLAMDYRNTIDYQQQKSEMKNKLIRWLKSKFQHLQRGYAMRQHKEKQTQEKKQQVQLQEQRKMNQRMQQQKIQQKLRRQADQILEKQFNQMEAKHRQKSLLNRGKINSQESVIRGIIYKQRLLRNTQKQIYRQGLQAQYQKQQNQRNQRRRAFSQNRQDTNTQYNPISNPIPFVYKNPNVLRMLNQF